MSKKETITENIYFLKNKFKQEFSDLVLMAKTCETPDIFKKQLKAFVTEAIKDKNDDIQTKTIIAKRIIRLIENDNTIVEELSTGEKLHIKTISSLWEFLHSKSEIKSNSLDLMIDLYHQFNLLKKPGSYKPSIHTIKRYMNHWPTGLDKEVMAIHSENKTRIIKMLVKKIEKRHAPSSKFQFDEGMSYEEKIAKVEEWWNNSRFHLSLAIKNPAELNTFLNNSMSEETLKLLYEAKKKRMPFFITPYYLSLLNTHKEGYNDEAIRSYIIYTKELVETYGNIKAWEKEDIVEYGKPNAAGWMLPEGNNIHRRYPEVAILIPDSMGRACGGLCASCQRMYDFQSERLNFDFEALKVKETWDHKLRRLMRYFEDDAQLRDILITGGDALMSQDATLRKILDAVYSMAKRKRKANLLRKDGEKFAEFQRVRLGSRLPAYLPFRVTDELVAVLREFKEKAQSIGISQCYIQTHFQSPLEVTPEAKRAISAILSAGWTVTNQLVYNVATSRRGHTAKLRQVLNSIGVVCYYTFSVKGFQENYAVFTPNSRSLQEASEEKIFGQIPENKKDGLHALIDNQETLAKTLPHFLKESKLPFAGTDRNVLNLPAIGKSMTFNMVGITEEGQRILQFDHDHSRHHSPIIDNIGNVYIVESKSIAAYLRQLKNMEENVNEYHSIWNYCEGETEPRFSIYEYPKYSFKNTSVMTNFEV